MSWKAEDEREKKFNSITAVDSTAHSASNGLSKQSLKEHYNNMLRQ